MSRLNQILATYKTIKARCHSENSALYAIIQKPAMFDGIYRTYQPKVDGGEQMPPERKCIQATVGAILDRLKEVNAPLFDIEIQRDMGNTQAVADISLDGVVLASNVPATTLLFLEKQLTDLKTFIEKLPVLDQAESWKYDASTGVYRSEPVLTHRTKKVQRSLVLIQPTPEHPGQATMITEDETVGFWNIEKVSGAISGSDKLAILRRCERLLLVVKEARESANMTKVDIKPKLGEAILTHIFG